MSSSTLATRVTALERDANDQLPAFAWPGGYPLVYVTARGDELCSPCATEELEELADGDAPSPEDPPEWVDVHYEGPPVECAACGALVESAYGDPDAV